MEGQPISPNQYYVTRLLKMIDYESIRTSISGVIDYRCTCVDIINNEIIKNVFITETSRNRLATIDECISAGKRNSYVEFKEE